MIKMKVPRGVTSVSFDGKAYEVSRDGRVSVPDHAVETLRQHGCVPGDEVDALDLGDQTQKAKADADAAQAAKDLADKAAAEAAAATAGQSGSAGGGEGKAGGGLMNKLKQAVGGKGKEDGQE